VVTLVFLFRIVTFNPKLFLSSSFVDLDDEWTNIIEQMFHEASFSTIYRIMATVRNMLHLFRLVSSTATLYNYFNETKGMYLGYEYATMIEVNGCYRN
jgi:hypothetical protein